MEPLTDVRAISDIGYGFMASKTLFAALNLDLFTQLSGREQTLDALSQATATASHRLLKLLTACVSLGLLAKNGEHYSNAPASEAYLVKGARGYFGDYFRYQVDRQAYPLWERLDGALQGEIPAGYYAEISSDPVEADHFTRAQHTGSLGPAHLLARRMDLTGRLRLLDVAGGSGAFAITLCRRNPQLAATILDFPHMIDVAKRYVAEAGLASRIDYIAGNALNTDWPASQDIVLMSYLLNAVSEQHISELITHAFSTLVPGGLLLLHDFMVGDDQTGPKHAALYLLAQLLADPDTITLTPGSLSNMVRNAGFDEVNVQDLVPGITMLLVARKSLEAEKDFRLLRS